jgi:integrase
LNADIRDYGHDHGHRMLKVTRKGGKTARVALAPPVVRALDGYLGERIAGRIFVARDGAGPYGYRLAYAQLGRLCRDAGLPAGVTPHSLRHSYATESLRLRAALQDVQDALGHADPRTTRRYDRSRHNLDRSPKLPSRRSSYRGEQRRRTRRPGPTLRPVDFAVGAGRSAM